MLDVSVSARKAGFSFVLGAVFALQGCSTGAQGDASDELGASPAALGASASSTGARDKTCASVSVSMDPPDIDVYILLDQSNSMYGWYPISDDEGTKVVTRAEAAKDLILGEKDDQEVRRGGIVREVGSNIRMGFASYSTWGAACPLINGQFPGDEIVARLDSYPAIFDVLDDANPWGGTPTGESIRLLTDRLDARGEIRAGKSYVLLITDGDPTTCEEQGTGGYEDGDRKTTAAIREAYAKGLSVIPVGVGYDFGLSSAKLQKYANLGSGKAENAADGAPYLRAANYTELRDELTSRLRRVRPCKFTLQGEITDMSRVCDGKVRLTSAQDPAVNQDIPCLTSAEGDGWYAADASHIELVGAACEAVQDVYDGRIVAEFACDFPIELE